MYSVCRAFVLHWLKVPPEPHPPAGAPSSLRVFRAGKNYFRLRLLGWAFAQLVALGGIIFWTALLIDVESTVREQRVARAHAPKTPAPKSFREALEEVAPPSANPPTTTKGKSTKPRVRINDLASFKKLLVNFALRLPPWTFPLIWVFKIGGLLLYLAQIPLTYAVRRLDYEMRWYVVTDRSLRIRTGVWQVQELTMSFANLQQVVVSQGPLQRLLGLADVHVQSAGGGGGGASAGHAHGAGDSLHTAVFHSVENATEIRDLILERLRIFRATGLGDPDDHHAAPAPLSASSPSPTAFSSASSAATLAAARELLTEARALRRTLGQ
jgi:membrane protein YdbS with pleckstrin-like domain